MTLPQTIGGVREIGDTSEAYWLASCSDGQRLDLAEGEMEPQRTARVQVEAGGAASWQLPDDTFVGVTNRRTVFINTGWDKGGGWVGFGALGLATALTANAISKRQATNRSEGRVAIGHVRHEWVTSVSLRKQRALIGLTDTYLDVHLQLAEGRAWLSIWGKALANESHARWLVHVIAYERLRLSGVEFSERERDMLRHAMTSRSGVVSSNGSLTWTLPGDNEQLIQAARAMAQGSATEGVSS